MKNFLGDLKCFLEKIDYYRDEFLFLFIKPYWPRRIIPNYLTYLRILIGIALFVLLFFFGIENKLLIISLFCFGVLTDLLDGSVARGINKVTEFGAMLDPLADRIIIFPIAVYSLFILHRWLLLILILTEILNAIASIYYKSKEIYIESNIFGKTKMVMQSIVFIIILIVWPYAPPLYFIYILWLTIPFSFIGIFTRIIELKKIKTKT